MANDVPFARVVGKRAAKIVQLRQDIGTLPVGRCVAFLWHRIDDECFHAIELLPSGVSKSLPVKVTGGWQHTRKESVSDSDLQLQVGQTANHSRRDRNDRLPVAVLRLNKNAVDRNQILVSTGQTWQCAATIGVVVDEVQLFKYERVSCSQQRFKRILVENSSDNGKRFIFSQWSLCHSLRMLFG